MPSRLDRALSRLPRPISVGRLRSLEPRAAWMGRALTGEPACLAALAAQPQQYGLFPELRNQHREGYPLELLRAVHGLPTMAGVIGAFGEKAQAFVRRPPIDDKRFTLLQGSVRSSKTWSMIPKMIALSAHPIGGLRLVVGESISSVKRNVLEPLFRIVGPANFTYNAASGDFTLFGVPRLSRGAADEGAQKSIQGATVGVAYCDELTTMHENFYRMLTSRLSEQHSRFYATTNPDSPFHWVKTLLIDNPELVRRDELEVLHFTLDDNPHIDAATKASIVATYTGLWYRRYILGEWCVADRGVYADAFSESLFYDGPRPRGDLLVGIDYGASNPTVFVLAVNDGLSLWIDAVYYHSGATEGGRTDAQYADDLMTWMHGQRATGAPVLVPPDAEHFDLELATRGLWRQDATNDVAPGIAAVAQLMQQRRLRFRRTLPLQCFNELTSYHWDPNKALRGEDAPKKEHDHFPDACRYLVNHMPRWWLLQSAPDEVPAPPVPCLRAEEEKQKKFADMIVRIPVVVDDYGRRLN